MPDVATISEREFPTAAGILFGLGLGGFFDGIVLHQVLQWHHMLSGWYPIDSIENLELNTLWDGIFHSSTYLFLLAGLFILWRMSHRTHLYWSNKLLSGTLLLGFGIFNCIEGVIDHELLGVHHVNEQVPVEQRIYWDIGFWRGARRWRSAAGCFGGRAARTVLQQRPRQMLAILAKLLLPVPTPIIWLGFGIAALIATRPVWSFLIRGAGAICGAGQKVP